MTPRAGTGKMNKLAFHNLSPYVVQIKHIPEVKDHLYDYKYSSKSNKIGVYYTKNC
jgi:hypothetical protein